MAFILCCGAECGIITAGLAASGNRHWDTVTGSPSIETSIVRSGSRSLKFAAAATRPYVTRTISASVAYARFYFRTDDATPSADTILCAMSGNATNNFWLRLLTTGTLEAKFVGQTAQVSAALSDNTWYGVEMEVDRSANPHVARWRVWSAAAGWVSQTNATYAAAADTSVSINLGEAGAGPTSGWNLYVDDVVFATGSTTGEYYSTSTARGGKVLRYLPTADLTHSFTTNDFEYNDATGIVNTATDVYTYIDDDDQTSLTDYISQNVAGAKYVQVSFADESTEGNPRCVAVTSTHHSSSTGANEMHLRVSDDGTNWTNVWGDWASAGVDVSDTTAHYLHKVLATAPSGGAWTQSAVNGMRMQWGNSDDVADVPYIDSVSLEVDWLTPNTKARGDQLGMMGLVGG